jgi:hypothetical protein
MDNSRKWAASKYREGGAVTESDPQYGAISYHNEPKDPPRYAGGGLLKKAAKVTKQALEKEFESAPKVSRIDMNYKDVTKRIPELTEAAKLLDQGMIDASEYDRLVNALKPVEAYDFVPEPASFEDAMRALTKNKQPMYGKTSEIPAGEQTDLRLDIPAYKDHGVWVNSVHRKDAPTVYGPVSSVKNATMIGSPEKAFKVAKGETPKAPFAVIRGEWNPLEQAEAVKRAQAYLNDPDWVQVGYDPERHGYFYGRHNMQPIEAAEEIIQIGPLVLAKNPRYAEKGKQKYAGGGLAKKALKEALAREAFADKFPIELKRAKPLTKKEITEHADRVARQQSGEFVRKSEISGKPSDTANLAGRSKKEVERLKELKYTLEPTKELRPTPTYEGKVGDVNIALPGDQTISDMRLLDVNGLPIESTQQGGSLYGEGKLHLEDPLFWASGRDVAQQFQDKVTALSHLYNTDDIMAHHLAMGEASNNYAMHFADANLRAIANSNPSKKAIKEFNKVIRDGFIDPKGNKIKLPHFVGIENPEEAYLQMMEDPAIRKWFNNRMKIDKYTTKIGLPSGKDIQWAITEPALRDMEVSLTGHSVGKMIPEASLTDTAEHATYEAGIPGISMGKAPELAPFELAFPDATDYVMATQRPQDFTGTIQKVFPHQVMDQQQLDQMSEYYRRLREIRGFKKGGEVDGHAGGGLIKKVSKKVLENKGKYGAERVEKAADLVPDLEKQFNEEALYRAFTGDNAKGLMVLDPSHFEEYAHPLSPTIIRPQSYSSKIFSEGVPEGMSYSEYLDYLLGLKGGFRDVPFLEIGEKGADDFRVTGHEGRHRTRALAKRGDKKTLIQMLPGRGMREPFPRYTQEEYIDALNAHLGLDPTVSPEVFPDVKLPLPKVFAKGGSANLEEEFKKADTIEKKPLRAIPQAVINALDKGRKLSPIEKKIAGTFSIPENQWKLGSILEEFDPVFTAGRGAEALKNVDYGAIGDLALQRYQLKKNPRESIKKGLENLGETAFGALDVAPAVGAVASKTGRNLIKNLVKEFEGAPVGLSIEDVTPKSVNFVSSVERAIKGHKMDAMNGEQWANWMRANASKSAKKEAEATGLYDWLKSQGKVSKADIEAYVEGNLPQIEPVVKSGPKATFATYTEPGGRNYREIVYGLKTKPKDLVMPEGFKITEFTYPDTGQTGYYAETPSTISAFFRTREEAEKQLEKYARNSANADDFRNTYRSGHYRDVDNPLLHMRVKDRETPEGRRVHFLEELQSDWAQKARKTGIKRDVTDDVVREFYEQGGKWGDNSTPWEELSSKDKAFLRHVVENKQIDAVPPAPYIGDTADWTKLGLKRALKDAIESGQDYLAWTTGQQQADRYSLSKYLENVRAVKSPDGTYSFSAYEKGANRGNLPTIAQHNLTENELADHLGKEMAQKIVNDLAEAKPTQVANYDNIDLQLGGEGMKGYYDKIMPQAMNDILKQYGITDGVKPVNVQYANKIYYDDRVEDLDDLLERGQLTPHQRQILEVFRDDIDSAKARGEDPWRLESNVAKWIAEQNRAPDTITEHMGIEITPELREKILNEGLPHFADGGEVDTSPRVSFIKKLVDEFSS